MNRQQIFEQISLKHSFLCVGLDCDIQKIPQHLLATDDPIFEFNRAIIDATAPYAMSYKPNLAFYEEHGARGWESFVRTVEYIKANYPEQFIIADAKRGDIGNTSAMYARAFFNQAGVDAVTLAPYMGRDSIDPFLKYEGKWAVILALTSNPSAEDFELQRLVSGEKLYEKVLRTTSGWGSAENTMYVVGATKAQELGSIRAIVPDHFLLVPGVGAQGGSLEQVYRYGATDHSGLIVNSSRAIIYASNGLDFATAAANAAHSVQQEMAVLLSGH
ncbi:MAG: orotidine-5'-phosphate decarboxylase [Mucinivorans sp.]